MVCNDVSDAAGNIQGGREIHHIINAVAYNSTALRHNISETKESNDTCSYISELP